MTTEAPPRPRLTPELQAVFDVIQHIDKHKEAPPLPDNAGRYRDTIQALIEALQESFDAYLQERTHFFQKNEYAGVLFAIYGTAEAKNEKAKRKRYPEPRPVAIKTVREYYSQNEYGDALLFAEVFDGQVCYDHTAKKWYLWAGHYWQKDTTGQIRILVSGKLGSVYLKAIAELNTEIAELEQNMKPFLSNPLENKNELAPLQEEYKQLGVDIKQFSARAKDLRSSKRMNNVSNFIQSLMSVTSSQWDTNPLLIGTTDGVINLHTGTLQDGNPDDYIRTIIPTAWTGLTTQCPRFERFLQEIFDDNKDKDAVIRFLHRLLGYGITGMTNDAIFPIAYGEEGRNGKDTLFGILKDVLGPLAGAVSNDIFVSNDKFRAGGAASPHICDLQGKRLVWGSETKQGDKLNINQLKHLTGGGDVSARPLYGEQYSFKPTHKLFLMTNYKPHADANDKAFWSRACLITFGLRFVSNPHAANERKADTQLKETIHQEASGILAWLVRGCLTWQEEGLSIPESIRLATENYRKEEDAVLQFTEECCVSDPEAKTKATPLYNAYKAWSKDQTNFTMSKKLFSNAMEKLPDITKKRSNQAIEYVGIRLIPAEDDGLFANGESPSKEGGNSK